MKPDARIANLEKGLKTEVELSLAGEVSQSAVLLLREDRLPMVSTTDSRGVVTTKVVSYVELLAALEGSTVVAALEDAETRLTSLPELPENTLLCDVIEEPAGVSYALTGYLEPGLHTFILEEPGGTATYDLRLPHIAWSILYDARSNTVTKFSLAFCSPEITPGLASGSPPDPAPGEGPATPRATPGRPTADTPIYRYPFSNVEERYGGAWQGVCWPTMKGIVLELSEVTRKFVSTFLTGVPNNSHLYGLRRSQNSPCESYSELLQEVEKRGGIPEDWLIPLEATVRDLHGQHKPDEDRNR